MNNTHSECSGRRILSGSGTRHAPKCEHGMNRRSARRSNSSRSTTELDHSKLPSPAARRRTEFDIMQKRWRQKRKEVVQHEQSGEEPGRRLGYLPTRAFNRFLSPRQERPATAPANPNETRHMSRGFRDKEAGCTSSFQRPIEYVRLERSHPRWLWYLTYRLSLH